MIRQYLYITSFLAGLIFVFPSLAHALEGTLDVLDGETLYEEGWLLTFGYGFRYDGHVYEGDQRKSNPLEQSENGHDWTAAVHFGLRNDIQLGLLMPATYQEQIQSNPAAPDHLGNGGAGDVVTLVKWRFHRWDTKGEALNTSAIAGIEWPTGPTNLRNNGVRLPPDLQAGGGAVSPFLAVASTYEPGRWRFNVFCLYQHRPKGEHRFDDGELIQAELAAGNRFWLERYPGPFMRLDLAIRYKWEGRARKDDALIHNSGGHNLGFRANLAFRPRPALDFQLGVEVPIYQNLKGRQLGHSVETGFTFGFRY